jgi:transcriptional regulator with XRE-family HTH domain
MSQDELAERASLSRGHVGLMEHGRRLPRLDTLVKLAVALEASTDDLAQGIEWLPPAPLRPGCFRESGR